MICLISYDGTWGWTLDFNIPGTYVQDTLMMAEDGTPGLNLEGNPVSQEACFPLINDLTGKIAVLYRNSCDFASQRECGLPGDAKRSKTSDR